MLKKPELIKYGKKVDVKELSNLKLILSDHIRYIIVVRLGIFENCTRQQNIAVLNSNNCSSHRSLGVRKPGSTNSFQTIMKCLDNITFL